MRRPHLVALLGLIPIIANPRKNTAAPAPDAVIPNDNRVTAGALHNGVLTVRLEAKLGAWRPDAGVDTTATVQVFAEESGAPRIPGPLLRATQGTEVVVTIRNSLGSTLVVNGLRAGTVENDTIQIKAGTVREVRYRAGAPGTYLYWGTTTKSAINDRPWRDGQLTGGIIVDAVGTRADTAERLFVITSLDIYKGDSVRNKANEDVWEVAINGRSWPHTEGLEYPVGRTVRWRWINGSYIPHPMHLHGFHFRVTGTGRNNRYKQLETNERPLAVTQFMEQGDSFAMEWTPTRPGTWLMHCHMIPHITPFPERPDSAHINDLHHLENHPASAMSGLVLGITTTDRRAPLAAVTPASAPKRLRVFAQQKPPVEKKPVPHGFVLQRGAEPSADSVEVPGAPLVLTRGERVAITVVNRLTRPTTVHWHGMELESVYDGVAGWSRTGGSLAPLIAPGDSFVVTFTPPRAGTFMYHTHIDEGPQLVSGMYGPMLVLEPGRRYDPSRDLVFMIGGAVEKDSLKMAINGQSSPAPLTLTRGTTYRLRFVNLSFADPARIALLADSTPLRWRPVAKDGADLPLRLVKPDSARVFVAVGEAYDFELSADRVVDAVLEVRIGGQRMQQVIRVR